MCVCDACVCTCVCACVCVLLVCAHVCVHVCVHACVLLVCVCCLCVCACVCACVSGLHPTSGCAQVVNMSSSQDLKMSGAPSGSRAAVSNQLFMNIMWE